MKKWEMNIKKIEVEKQRLEIIIETLEKQNANRDFIASYYGFYSTLCDIEQGIIDTERNFKDD